MGLKKTPKGKDLFQNQIISLISDLFILMFFENLLFLQKFTIIYYYGRYI